MAERILQEKMLAKVTPRVASSVRGKFASLLRMGKIPWESTFDQMM